MTSIHAPFTTEVECKMASFTHVENFGVHAPRLIRIDGHDPVRVSLEAPLKYGPELQLGIMQLEREGSPPPGLRLPQAKLSRKSNQVARGRIRRFESYMPSQPVRLHCVTEDGRTKTARYRVVSRWQGGFQKGVDQHRVDERMPQQFHQRCRAGVTGHNVRLWQPTFNDSCSSASRPRFYLPPQVTRYGPGFKIKRSGCRSTARARSRLRWLRR